MMTSRSSRPVQPRRIVGETRQRVGVEHERHRRSLDQRAHELGDVRRRGRGPGRTRSRRGASSSTRSTRRAVDAAAVGLGERLGHVLRRHRRDDRQARTPASRRSRGRRPTAARPCAARCAAPVLPREPATIVTRPKSPLCESARARLDQLAQLFRRQQLDVRPVEPRSRRTGCRCRR